MGSNFIRESKEEAKGQIRNDKGSPPITAESLIIMLLNVAPGFVIETEISEDDGSQRQDNKPSHGPRGEQSEESPRGRRKGRFFRPFSANRDISGPNNTYTPGRDGGHFV